MITVNSPPRIPADLENDEGDDQTNDRVRDSDAGRDDRGACNNSERDEAVDAGVIAIRDQG